MALTCSRLLISGATELNLSRIVNFLNRSMLEVPWLLSCYSLAKLDARNTESVRGFIVRREGRLARNGSGGSARDSSHACRLRSHDNTGLRVVKCNHQGELCKTDRGAAIRGRVPRSMHSWQTAEQPHTHGRPNTTMHRDSPNAALAFFIYKIRNPGNIMRSGLRDQAPSSSLPSEAIRISHDPVSTCCKEYQAEFGSSSDALSGGAEAWLPELCIPGILPLKVCESPTPDVDS
jgi:hypothetical protein